MSVISNTRLYAASIALVSGAYSVTSAIDDDMGSMPMSDSVMLLTGAVVMIHGVVLLTPLATALGRASGLLMVLWAAIMLGNQALAPSSAGMMGGSGWDGGMVGLALLMLASGLIMIRARASM